MWEDNIQGIRGNRKNSRIFKEIAENLLTYGHSFSGEEVRIKIHNLSNKYRIEKKKVGPSGGSPSEWVHYNRVHAIIGGYKCNSIEDVMQDSLESDISMFNVEYLDDFESALESSISSSPETEIPKKRKRQSKLPSDEAIALLRESLEFQKSEAAERLSKLQEEFINIENKKIKILEQILM